MIADRRTTDIHTFRLEGGKLRYVHTLTVCLVNNCGMPKNPGSLPPGVEAK